MRRAVNNHKGRMESNIHKPDEEWESTIHEHKGRMESGVHNPKEEWEALSINTEEEWKVVFTNQRKNGKHCPET